MANSKPNRTHSAMLAIRTTDEDAERYKQMCTDNKLSQAVLLHRLMAGVSIIVINNVRDAWIELRKEGANLNQIAYRLNTGDTVTREEIRKALEDNRRGIKVLLGILKNLKRERSL